MSEIVTAFVTCHTIKCDFSLKQPSGTNAHSAAGRTQQKDIRPILISKPVKAEVTGVEQLVNNAMMYVSESVWQLSSNPKYRHLILHCILSEPIARPEYSLSS